MNRRELFGAVAGVLLALSPVAAVEPAPKPKYYRRWYRFMRDTDRWVWDRVAGKWVYDPWEPIDFADIREGMEIWVEDSVTGNEVVYASSDCIRGEFFTVGARIDPATNTWVDVPCRNTK